MSWIAVDGKVLVLLVLLGFLLLWLRESRKLDRALRPTCPRCGEPVRVVGDVCEGPNKARCDVEAEWLRMADEDARERFRRGD